MSKRIIPEEAVVVCDVCKNDCNDSATEGKGARSLRGTFTLVHDTVQKTNGKATMRQSATYNLAYDLCDTCLLRVKAALNNIIP